MFEPKKADLIALSRVAKTRGGEVLIEYADHLAEEAKNSLINEVRADDYAAVAGAQVLVKICGLVKTLLQTDVEVLLAEYGFNLEEDDNEE